MDLLHHTHDMSKRFRGFLPVVIDVETAGFNAKRDALLEVAAVIIHINEQGQFYMGETLSYHIKPFEGANLDEDALEFNKIDPYHPFRFAVDEKEALTDLFKHINRAVNAAQCSRGILVGHNAWFDLSFMKAAAIRCALKSPLHNFSSIDTATLGALFFGQTVLAKSMKAAKIPFDTDEAHSAIYDTEKTAELFCKMLNHWQSIA